MASLNVIALISGGKDSIYSILHVLSLGHRVIALGNLYPPQTSQSTSTHDGDDPNSHMYQTAGHSLIPSIAACLGLPLIRREITGSNISTSATYVKPGEGEGRDETEDLDALLRDIMGRFPEANAVSSGAILSTYQRTRIETVAVRLGLVPLALLWQYTTLTSDEGEDALLKHMGSVGLEARIVKVASGGLDEGNLWEDVASWRGREKIKKRIMRFGEGEGAVIGEGGEYETLVLNGPDHVWKYHMVVDKDERVVVKGEGGTASMAFKTPKDGDQICRLEQKTLDENAERPQPQQPKLLESTFQKIFDILAQAPPSSAISASDSHPEFIQSPASTSYPTFITHHSPCPNTYTFTVSGSTFPEVIASLRSALTEHQLTAQDVTSTAVLIKSMADFPNLNTLYSSVFKSANPPSRACVAVGTLLPNNTVAVMHITAFKASPPQASTTKALHVQSRSYWAPANIGPYSQAQSFLLAPSSSSSARAVSVAGQIPLIPATMTFTKQFEQATEKFVFEATLAAQYVWRIGREMGVQLFTSGIAFLPRLSEEDARQKAIVAGQVWRRLHTAPSSADGDDTNDSDEEEDVDLWELQNRRGEQQMGASAATRNLPDWETIKVHHVEGTKRGAPDYVSPFWAAEVETLPMSAAVEWLPGLGVSGAEIEVLPPNEMMVFDEGSSSESMHEVVAYNTLVAGKWLMTTYFVYATEKLKDWKYLIDSLRSTPSQGDGWGVNGTECVFVRELEREAERCYIDVSAPAVGFWESVKPGSVPCRRVFDAEGKRLAAVCCFRDEVVPRELAEEDEAY